VQVPMAIFAAWALGTEAVKPGKLVPIAIAFAGVAIIIGLPDQAPPLGFVLITLAGTAAWGIGQALIAKFGQDDPDLLLKRTSLHGAIQLTILTAVFESGQWNAVTTASAAEWAGFAYNAIISFAVAYVIWYGLLKRNPVSAVTPFIMVVPVVTIITAVVFRGESLDVVETVGAALILLGVALAIGIIRNRFAG
jgi:O-acetylserine/cysteine efflux transporter